MKPMSHSGKGRSSGRVVTYHFTGPVGLDIERRLARARSEGVVTTYDDGRGDVPWFQGAPGAALRALRAEFVKAGAKPGRKEYEG
jgi:hypothetical protein